MEILKVLGFCLVSSVLSLIFKQQRQEYAFFISVAAAISVLSLLCLRVFPQLEEIKVLISSSGIEMEYFKVALKALGIAYLTEFTADTCRDFGQGSIASKAELAGKAAIFIISIPLLASVLKTALELV
ncbi:MAG: stage III sporulation protein AD [Ruminococcaceae bacterium]|nr:stage III sporulation protein AD [Oscillospiraceae bacterium]